MARTDGGASRRAVVTLRADPRCRLAVMTRQLTHTLVISTMLGAWAVAEQTSPEQRSRALEVKELAVPFKGITANGQVEPGLFRLTSTGVSTEPVRKAAETFLASLTA